MQFKSIFRELKGKNDRDDKLKQPIEHKNREGLLSLSFSSYVTVQQGQWANLPPELLLDIIGRVEANETTWPARRAVVSCAAVCKSWREITREVIRTPEECGLLTLPFSLKQPGPRDTPIQCYIRRERSTSTYRLYLGLSHGGTYKFELDSALSGDASKLLYAAKRIRKATKTEFVISLAANDFSQTSDNYAGNLRSNFFGSKFIIYDCQSPPKTGVFQSHGLSRKRISTKKVSPRLPLCNYKVATITYELNVLRTRGPRRMCCTMHSIPTLDETLCPVEASEERKDKSSSNKSIKESLVLKNKTPRWHEQLQCWCLNFRGRVTVASVKNFQLVASEQEKVILQFGKIGKDIFTMDYRSIMQGLLRAIRSFPMKYRKCFDDATIAKSHTIGEKGLPNTTVGEVLTSKGEEKVQSWLWCHTNDTVHDALKQMVQNNIGSLVVLKPGEQKLIAGIFTERDNHIRHVPVIDGKIIGMISIGDVVRAVLEQQHGEMKRLNEFIHGDYY
ncbi:hypothetical protein ACJIZ3_024890 [Penstemon smallii]|uniref:CBS domain-containing protein n=1 Tax=Penstemon smallii TaxID=265156 RepID=A0ABD3TT41_9LAMI